MTAEPLHPAGSVLWHAPGDPPPEELIAAFQRKHITPQLVSDRFSALAKACRLRPEGMVVLLLHKLERLVAAHGADVIGDLLEALALYVPSSTVWVYDPASTPELRAFRTDDLEAFTGGTREGDGAHAAGSQGSRAWAPAGRGRAGVVRGGKNFGHEEGDAFDRNPRPGLKGGSGFGFGAGARGSMPDLRLVDVDDPVPTAQPATQPNAQPSAQPKARSNPVSAGPTPDPAPTPDQSAAPGSVPSAARDAGRDTAVPAQSQPQEKARQPSTQLTDEELAMLLGTDERHAQEHR